MADFYVGDVLFGADGSIDTSGDIKITAIQDCSNSTGTAGQVLSSTGSALEWIDAGGGGGIASVTGTAPISVDVTDPANPVISVNAGTAISCGALIGITQRGAGTCLNTALGADAGCSLSTGAVCNTFVGNLAGRCTTSGTNNVALGSLSGCGITTGCFNIAIGSCAICNGAGVTGADNIAIGRLAGRGFTSANFNVAIGFCAGANITTGVSNVVIGCCAGSCITTGGNHVAIGCCALGRATCSAVCFGNVAIGTFAGICVCQGFNVAIGSNAGMSGRASNVAVGASAGSGMGDLTDRAVFIGSASGPSDGCGVNHSLSVQIGGLAGYFQNGCENTIVGGCAMVGTVGSVGCGANRNVAVGLCAMNSAGIGASENVVVGRGALGLNNSGAGNVAIGCGAGPGISTGCCNVVIGHRASTGGNTCQNLAIGLFTGNWLTGDSTFAIKPGKGIIDCANSCGTAGQVLTSTGSNAIEWAAGATGTFTSQDGKTITVTNGLITSIV